MRDSYTSSPRDPGHFLPQAPREFWCCPRAVDRQDRQDFKPPQSVQCSYLQMRNIPVVDMADLIQRMEIFLMDAFLMWGQCPRCPSFMVQDNKSEVIPSLDKDVPRNNWVVILRDKPPPKYMYVSGLGCGDALNLNDTWKCKKHQGCGHAKYQLHSFADFLSSVHVRSHLL